MTKLTITITNTFEVEAAVSANTFPADPTDPGDWEVGLLDDVVCLETGCVVDDSVILGNDDALKQIIKHFYDNYEPPEAW